MSSPDEGCAGIGRASSICLNVLHVLSVDVAGACASASRPSQSPRPFQADAANVTSSALDNHLSLLLHKTHLCLIRFRISYCMTSLAACQSHRGLRLCLLLQLLAQTFPSGCC